MRIVAWTVLAASVCACGSGASESACSADRRRDARSVALDRVADSESSWTDFYGVGEVAVDSTVYVEGGESLKLVTSNADLTGARLSMPSSNWSNRGIRFYVRSDHWEQVDVIEMLVSTDGVFSSYFTSSFSYELASPADDDWLEVILTRSNFAVGGGTPDWSTVNGVIFRTVGLGQQPTSIHFDDLSVFEAARRPIVSFVFDDGWISQFTTAMPKMDEYGFKGTAYVIPSGVGSDGFLTQAQIDAIADNGWDISGHGDTNLTVLTAEDAEQDVCAAHEYLSSHGYTGQDHYAYPNGGVNPAVRDIVDRYFTTGRTTNRLGNSLGYIPAMSINSYQVYDSLSLETVRAAVDSAIRNNEWLILGFHDIAEDTAGNLQWATADFNELVDYIAASGVQVRTVSEVWEMYVTG